jgi:hypothetical protein
MVRLHFWLTIAWIVLLIPTVLWWRTSILWVLMMSIWANTSTHWSAWQGARAEKAQADMQHASGPAPAGERSETLPGPAGSAAETGRPTCGPRRERESTVATRVVVGFDGSEEARRALDWAVQEAGIRNAPLRVVAAVQGIPPAELWGAPAPARVSEENWRRSVAHGVRADGRVAVPSGRFGGGRRRPGSSLGGPHPGVPGRGAGRRGRHGHRRLLPDAARLGEHRGRGACQLPSGHRALTATGRRQARATLDFCCVWRPAPVRAVDCRDAPHPLLPGRGPTCSRDVGGRSRRDGGGTRTRQRSATRGSNRQQGEPPMTSVPSVTEDPHLTWIRRVVPGRRTAARSACRPGPAGSISGCA